MATFDYEGDYTIAFEEEDVLYPGLTDAELTRVKKSIREYLTPSTLKDIIVEGDVTSWNGADKLGLRLTGVKLGKTSNKIQLGDYFKMTLTFQTNKDISDAYVKKIRKAIKNRFDGDNSQGLGAEFGREEVAFLV